MHWVDRGSEPNGLANIRTKYTPKWVRYYPGKMGKKPSDSRWRGFIDELGQPFSYYCGYCETSCRGEVDHFRPSSKFPKLVYEWVNWIFSCHDCNHSKLHKWPLCGFIDPCTTVPEERPENFFYFDLETGEILPKNKLKKEDWEKALLMVNDLKLNEYHHLRGRITFLKLVSKIISEISEDSQKLKLFIDSMTQRELPRSSFILAWLEGEGFLK